MHPALLDRFSPGYSGSRSIAQVRADIRTEVAERAPRRVSGMMIAGWDPFWLLSSDRGKYAPIPHRVALAWMTGSARVALADFPYERCADCGAEVHVSRLDDGLCTQCVIADRYTESTLR